MNEYTTADAVPDLLKPYVAYSNLWPTEDNDDSVASMGHEPLKLTHPESLPSVITSPTLFASRSHDSALSMIATNIRETARPIPPETNSPNVNSMPDEKTKIISDATNFDDEALKEEDAVEYLSLEDISPDEILPGPAREVYDGSDTDSFYSLSFEDDNHSHASGGSGLNKNSNSGERKYRYRKTLVPSQEQIKSMDLTDGLNEISFEAEVRETLEGV